MEFDYAGAREMMNFVENLWGWEATTPDLVTDSDWNQIYDVYVNDKYDLGLDEYFKENPYQYQSMTARMLETARKGSWDASDEVIQNLVSEYVESVVESGVTCCHHTCGNALLDEYIQGVMSVPGVVDEETAEEYERLMQEATESSPSSESSSHSSSKGHQTSVAEKLNQTSKTPKNQSVIRLFRIPMQGMVLILLNLLQRSDKLQIPITWKVMRCRKSRPKKQKVEVCLSRALISLGTLFVMVAAGGIYLGFRKKKF